MFLIILIIVVIFVIAKGNGYWAADKRNKMTTYFGGSEGYCHECKHCRERNGGMICALSRTYHITPETKMPCFEKPTMTEQDLKELFKLDLWTDAGKVYISQNLCGRRMTYSELDAFLKRIPIERPHYLKENEKNKPIQSAGQAAQSTASARKPEFKPEAGKTLEQQLIAYAEQYKQPRYKIDMLRESFRRGHEIEGRGFHVMQSIEKKLPYFCETEQEEKMVVGFFELSPLTKSIDAVMNVAWYYNEQNSSQAHTLKRKFWQDKIVDVARNGNREAQAALCSQYAKNVFSDAMEQVEYARNYYEEKLWEDARAGDKEAMLGVGAWLCDEKNDEAIEWLKKATEHQMTDAYYWLAQKMKNKRYELKGDASDLKEVDEWSAIRLEILECYRKGAECANGNRTAYCQRQIAIAYEDGDEIPQNLDLAMYWYEKAATLGDEYSKKHLESRRR